MFSMFRVFEAIGAHDAGGVLTAVFAGIDAVAAVKEFPAEGRRDVARRQLDEYRFAVVTA